MTNDQIQMTNDENRMTNYQIQMTNDESRMTNDQMPMTNWRATPSESVHGSF